MRTKRWLILLFTAILYVSTVIPAHAATITVNTLADVVSANGACSLREAIANANNDNGANADCASGSGSDTINLSVTGSYTLTASLQLDVSTTIIIQESGGATAIIEAATTPNTATWRVFNVTSSGNLTLTGITVRNGNIAAGSGGCIQAGASTTSLTLNGGTVIENCRALSNGGGVFSVGALTINNSTLQNNSLTGAATALGGGLFYSGASLSITTGTFSGNTVSGTTNARGGGAYIGITSGTGTITGSAFTSNSVSGGSNANTGGGLHKLSGGTLSVTTTSFTSNSASGTAAEGGAIYNAQATLTITSSRIESNSAASDGDALFVITPGVATSTSITDSCIVNNGDTAVSDTDGGSITTATDNWWGSIWGPYIPAAGAGHAISNGDSITGNGASAVNVGIFTSGGNPGPAPTGTWKSTAPNRAGATCRTCTAPSSIGHARSC